MRLLQVLSTTLMILLYIQPMCCSEFCSGGVSVPVAEGEDVILQINETEVRDISWIFGGFHIITTEPGHRISVKHRKWRERLQGTDQGSLKISNVHMQDQGDYSATVFKKKEKECVQHFMIKVYPKLSIKDIEIRRNVSDMETCSLTCIVNQPDVTTFWSNQSEINTVVRNNTLTLYNTYPNGTYNCTAENPVVRISRSIKPWTFCQEEKAISLAHRVVSYPIWMPIVVIMMFIQGLVLCP